MQLRTKTWLGSGVIALASIGCGAAAPPPEIASAQRQLVLAHNGEAGRRNPAELLVAERTLRAAERAQESDPDTTEGRDLAYIAHRQTLVAEAHARGMAIAEAASSQQADYQRSLETSNREAREDVEASSRRGQQQDQTIARQQAELATAQAGRAAADARTTEAMRRLTELASVREADGRTTITILGSVLFRSGGSELLAGASERLGAVADALNAQPERGITVEGFTDSRGSEVGNQALSQARADSVRTFLVNRGVVADRVRAVGFGQARPVADNATPEGRANNRRVEIVLAAIPADRQISQR